MPEWRPAFGFDAFQVDQAVEYHRGSEFVTLFRGRFDENEVRAALTRSGYAPVTLGDATFLSSGEDFDINFESPASVMAVGSMNNATVLPDGTLAFASTRDGMRAVLDVAAGSSPTFVDQAGVAPLVRAVRPDLASAWILPGAALKGQAFDPSEILWQPGSPTPDVGVIATRTAVREAEIQRMPPIATALLGITTGGPLPPNGRTSSASTPPPLEPGMAIAGLQIGLLMLSPAAAETAAGVVAERLMGLGTGPEHTDPGLANRPYAELFPEHTVQVSAGGEVVVVDLGLGPGTPRNALVVLLFERDLGLVAW